MLVANAVVDTDQPRLQVGENQMDDRQVLLGNLWITTLGNSEVLIAALTEASIAAPIVSNDQRSRRDGALDEPTERLGATVEHDGEPNASGIASVFPVVELGARLSMTHLDGTGDGNLVVNTTAFPTRSPANPALSHGRHSRSMACLATGGATRMKNLWSGTAARAMAARYAKVGIGRDLPLRVYTTRLLGGDPRLVLHGGGNTSVKTQAADLAGDAIEVLCVKGSGWDMAAIEPPGLPAVRLEPLRRLIGRRRLSDEDMVAFQRANLLDPAAPNPSVETLLHAFLPHKYVDHTHANAVLSLTDQPDGAEVCAAAFGERAAVVPYIMPGFALAKKVAEAHAKAPHAEGVIALKHGIFTFGGTAKEAYGRMIALVSVAEAHLRKGRRVFPSAPIRGSIAPVAAVAPIVRGACAAADEAAEGSWRRLILDFRTTRAVRAYVDGAELDRYSQAGVVTPDHVIRTKRVPLVVPLPRAARLDDFAAAARKAVARYARAYDRYFARHNANAKPAKIPLDPMPRVVLVPGLGLFGLGSSAKAAGIAADIAENTVDVVTAAESVGRFRSLTAAQTFAMEYWSLEQAKLGTASEKPLQRHVVVVTGGAGGIGAATAAAFAAEGSEIVVLDKNATAAVTHAASLGGLAIGCDVTDADAVRAPSIPCARPTAASISSSPTPARRGRAASARSTRRACGRVSSSTSSPTRTSRRPRWR